MIWIVTDAGDIVINSNGADDTIHIELEHGNLYLNLAQSKGVAILANDGSKSTVRAIKADSVDVSDAVKVISIIPYQNAPRNDSTGSTGVSGGSSSYSGNSVYGNGYSSGYSNFASNPSSFATLGSSTFTNNGLTYWQNATSTDIPNYSFSEFTSLLKRRG